MTILYGALSCQMVTVLNVLVSLLHIIQHQLLLLISVEIGLDQPMYTLNESNTVYTRRLRLLAPTGYTGFARPRLRLNGIPGTAGGELNRDAHILVCLYRRMHRGYYGPLGWPKIKTACSYNASRVLVGVCRRFT